jgi:hypothetical protein
VKVHDEPSLSDSKQARSLVGYTYSSTLHGADLAKQRQPEERKQRHDAETPYTPTSIESKSRSKKVCTTDLRCLDSQHLINYWLDEGSWPEELFEPGIMTHLLARKPPTSLRRKRSEAGSVTSASTPSDQRPRDDKSLPYKDVKYETQLELREVYLEESPVGIATSSREWRQKLIENEQSVPNDSLFQDSCFTKLCKRIKNRNEARIVQDIARLVVPSAECMSILSTEYPDYLVESVNEGWNNAVPLFGTRPQSDYSVGFGRNAFSSQQHEKLAPYVGDFPGNAQSYFMATWYMHFPFLASEVKCNSAGLDVADRQNAHSTTLAVRAVVELFRMVKRETEVDREILAFSVSHDSRCVRIYGHYPVIQDGCTYHRHLISSYDLTANEGERRWFAYKFIANVYKLWVPNHLARLRSAIDALSCKADCGPPNPREELEIMQESFPRTGSSMTSAMVPGHRSSTADVEALTPETSFTSHPSPSKRHRG